MTKPETSAVIEVSDDANEDRWGDAFGQAESAVGHAAEVAGAHLDELTVERGHLGAVTVRTSAGRAFCAVVRTTRATDRIELLRTIRPE